MNDRDLCLEVAIEYLGNRQRCMVSGYKGPPIGNGLYGESNGQVTDDIT